jgi:uncharacterized protein (DUF885 family)
MSRLLLFLSAALAGALVTSGPIYATPDYTMVFERLLELDWNARVNEDPLFATDLGIRIHDARLPEKGLADHRRRYAHDKQMLLRLSKIDRQALGSAHQVSYAIFERLKRDAIKEHEFGTHTMPITNRSGFHVSFPQLPSRVILASVEDYENYISRLSQFYRFTEQHIELMRAGIERGLVLPAIVLQGYETSIDTHIVDDPTASLLFAPFEAFPETVPEAAQERLAEAGRQAISASVVPAYRLFAEFMSDEYVPAARETIGASQLPDGKEFYEHRVRRFTTLDLNPEQVHEIGVAEVRRIRAEMEAIIGEVEFNGDFEAFVDFLRSDDRFYAKTPEELISVVSTVMKRMDGELPRLFKTLPRMPYGIQPVPDYIAPKTTTAYYEPPGADGRRAGIYRVNTYDLKSRPLYEVETLSLHEAVPGHHLQIALQQEMTRLPMFRRFSGFTAFGEGWALYAERLGEEVGFYDDPYSRFGHLSYEMWRACRLVVDTGLHYMDWSRQRAIDFMLENTSLSEHNVITEIDRYIAWPGQALGYKIGEIKIRELRAQAAEELGPAFDLREFHDAVLLNGSVPLDVLDENVQRYIARRK